MDLETHPKYIGQGGLYWAIREAVNACKSAGIKAGISAKVKKESDYLVIADFRRGMGQTWPPYISYIHGFLDEPFSLFGKDGMDSNLSRFFLRSEALVSVSKQTQIAYGEFLDRPIFRIWNTVDPKVFFDKPTSREGLLAVGALIPRKRPDRLTELGMPIDLVGQNFGYKFKLGSNVRWLREQPRAKVADLMRTHKVLVHVAAREECPMVILEALACGTPIVAMDSGDIREVLVGGCGEVVAQDDMLGLKRAVEKVLGEWESYHTAALIRAQDFSPEVIGARWKYLFNSLGENRARPKVSIIIPCYSVPREGSTHAIFLKDALGSVQQQTFQDWECIVVDDGSTAGDIEGVVKIKNDKRFKVVRQNNRGLSEARNTGISLARGEYILPLDADDKLSPEALEVFIETSKKHPPHTILYSDLYRWGPGVKPVRVKMPDFSSGRALKQSIVPYCCFYPKQVWLDCGGYKWMGVGFEDWEITLTMLERGYNLVRIPQPLWYYRKVAGSMIETAMKEVSDLRIRLKQYHPQLKVKVVGTKEDPILEAIPESGIALRYLGKDPPFSIRGPSGRKYRVNGPNSTFMVEPEDAQWLAELNYFRRSR